MKSFADTFRCPVVPYFRCFSGPARRALGKERWGGRVRVPRFESSVAEVLRRLAARQARAWWPRRGALIRGGVSRERIRHWLDRAAPQSPRPTPPRPYGCAFDPPVFEGVNRAIDLAARAGARRVTEDHLLLGMLSTGDPAAAEFLRATGTDLGRLADAMALTRSAAPPGPAPSGGEPGGPSFREILFAFRCVYGTGPPALAWVRFSLNVAALPVFLCWVAAAGAPISLLFVGLAGQAHPMPVWDWRRLLETLTAGVCGVAVVTCVVWPLIFHFGSRHLSPLPRAGRERPPPPADGGKGAAANGE